MIKVPKELEQMEREPCSLETCEWWFADILKERHIECGVKCEDGTCGSAVALYKICRKATPKGASSAHISVRKLYNELTSRAIPGTSPAQAQRLLENWIAEHEEATNDD